MARDVIKSRVQLLHDTEAHWKQVESTFVPLAGEPCITIDGPNRNKVKYGDGLHTWGEIQYSGDTIAVDDKSITVLDNAYTIKGFDAANANQVLSKSSGGEVEWITPPQCRVEKVCIGSIESELIPTEDHEVVIPIATNQSIGVVKGSRYISINNEGELEISEVPSSTISDVESLASNVSEILNLKPIASSDFNSEQFEIDEENVLEIKKVDSNIVQYGDDTVANALGTLEDRVTWNNF